MLATTWVPGEPSPRGSGDPAQLRRVLGLLAEVDLTLLHDVPAPPHAYAGGDRWETVMRGQVVPLLPSRWPDEARRRIEAALSLPAVPPRLVHGDLAGDNMRWDGDGRLIGVLDWEVASAWDPAVDAACLSWHGWEAVERAVDRDTYRRARVWGATFGIEQVAAALVRDAPTAEVDRAVDAAAAWLGAWPGLRTRCGTSRTGRPTSSGSASVPSRPWPTPRWSTVSRSRRRSSRCWPGRLRHRAQRPRLTRLRAVLHRLRTPVRRVSQAGSRFLP